MSGVIRKLLLLPHIHIHNANALSSPYTIGFPAMTAWLGAVHALQRKLNAAGLPVRFEATGVVCHTMDLQTYQGPNDFVASIIGTGNPLEPKTEKGNPSNAVRPSFIEEARCHLDVSLVVDMTGVDADDNSNLHDQITRLLHSSMKLAGGDILRFSPPETLTIEDGNPEDMALFKRRLMPGYALMERRDLMAEAMEQGQDALDALVDYLAIHHRSHKDENGDVSWTSQRKVQPVKEGEPSKPAGWIVPIATGFHGITPLGDAKNQRDPDTPHRFAESLVTLGEFKMPYRLGQVNDMLWRYHFDKARSLYLCQQAAQQDTGQASQQTQHNTDTMLAMDNSIASEFE
ncbi:type I-F CRISPR-associated protein Csy2 [Parendozoicomonas sp. Alg238-R29]|uniref:type I-F CRISPR-associated protein Csy2 n=1 Tax=Parendozoicomonas sp. Alg238-R29 TaxID=2993446 RepID=UPI00248D79D7|nr:type I-F CRISPR-associated protein Csy2 [Parendozoicomonas sp. Alg238-R29]